MGGEIDFNCLQTLHMLNTNKYKEKLVILQSIGII